jgi:predicted DNA-binding protein
MVKNITRSIRISPDDKELLDLLAEHRGLSFSKTVNLAIEYFIAHEYDLIRMLKLKKT